MSLKSSNSPPASSASRQEAGAIREHELARREKEVADFLDEAPHAVHSVGPDGRILWTNQAELDLLGYGRDEYVGHSIAEFHVDSDVIDGVLQRLLAGETLHDQPARLRCSDGSVKHVLIDSNSLWENGKLIHSRCFTRDVTPHRLIQDQLHERDIMLRLAMRSTHMGTWVRDLEDDTVQWSPELEQLFGIPPGGFNGTFEDFTQFVHPEQRATVRESVLGAIAAHQEFHIEFRFRHASGEWRWMEARGRALYDAQGEPRQLHGIAIDVTERLRAEETRALLAAIVESSDDAIVSKTLTGVITSWNTGASRILGYSAEEMVGKPIITIIPLELHHEEQEILRKLRLGERIDHFETVRVHKDGHRVNVSLTVSPVRDGAGNVIGVSKVARDITARKLAENALREEALARQREIAQRMEAEASLRDANQRKDEFLAVLAHELRNPLAPIRYAISIAKRAGRTVAQRKHADDVIERQVGHMARLIDDLLDISRITRGSLELRKSRIELNSAISAAIEAARPVLDAKQHTLTIDLPTTPIRLDADAVRLAQIFSNLLTNAAKYTDAGGQIKLRVFQEDRDVIVAIRDNGIGIAPEVMPRLFTMFSQAASALERAEGGLGIGLALVRGLVTLHGGTISAHSEGANRGSEFIVRLPVDVPAADEDAAAGAAQTSARGSGLRVLVADDNLDSAATCAMLLELSGHEVEVAHAGLRALELARTFRPHAALLDIGMPELNGYDLAEAIRAEPWGQQMILIAVTGWGQADDKRRALEAGFNHHLTKPIEPTQLEVLLQSDAALPA